MDITLRDHALPVTIPSSYAARYDLLVLHGENPIRAVAGALVACTPCLSARQRTGLVSMLLAGKTGAYGGACLDALHEAGLSVREVVEAGRVCYDACIDGLYTEEELKGSEDFSAAPAGGSTETSSISATPGDSPLPGGEGSPTTSR